jgi:hypothetical protein
MSEESPTSEAVRLEPLSLAWRLFAAPETLIVLLGVLALVLLLGASIPQIPDLGVDDPQAWLAVQPGPWGQSGGLLYALGFFDIHNAFWFHLLLALTGLTLFVWFVESVDLAWRATGREGWTPIAFVSWGRHAPKLHVSTRHSVEETLARIHDFLNQNGYSWSNVPGLPAPNLVAGRRKLLLWLAPVLFGTLLVVLVSLAIGGIRDWRSQDWQPAPGESRTVGHDKAYAVRLDAFEMEQDEEGRLRAYQSEISWLEDGTVVSSSIVGVGRPAALQGVTVRQIGYVPAVTIRGRDGFGQPLAFQTGEEQGTSTEVEMSFPASSTQQVLLVSGHDLILAFAFEPLCAEGKPALHVARLDGAGNGQQALAVLYESGSLAVDALHVEVALDYRPILRADHRPAFQVVVGGMILAVIALAVGWLVPPRLVWIALGGSGEDRTLVRILALPGAKGSRWLPVLADDIREAVADDA